MLLSAEIESVEAQSRCGQERGHLLSDAERGPPGGGLATALKRWLT